mmetsp:Transcript_22998/g.38836  ORF Transcript_22998/g.38836 Transcript_22998/m.38836 type:complete len:272 (+) Transcript_22998:367-1182(+)
MQRAGRHQSPPARGNLFCRALKLSTQRAVHGNRLQPQKRAKGKPEAHLDGDLVQGRLDNGLHARQTIHIRITPLHRKPHFARHNGRGIWADIYMANGPNSLRRDNIPQPVVQSAGKGDKALNRVPTQCHRRCACMVLLTRQGDDPVANTDNICDHANLLTSGIKDRTLLDMQLDKTGKLRRVHVLTNARAQTGARIRQQKAVMITQSVCGLQTQSTGPNIRPGCHTKAAFLILKRHNRNRRTARFNTGPRHFQSRHNTQRTIKPTTGRLAV